MKELLDNGFKDDWTWAIGDRGELLWHDKPEIDFVSAMSETRDKADHYGGGFGFIVIFWIFVLYYVAKFYQQGYVLMAFVVGVIGFVLPFVGDLFFYYKTSKIEYAISQKAIFFKIYNGWKFKVYTIPMSDIISINLVGNSDERATIHIVTEEQVAFRTYDSMSRKRRDHPTLEFIRDSKTAYDIIKNRIKNNPPRTLKYKSPVLPDWGLQVLQFFISGIIGLYIFMGVKYFIQPLIKYGTEGISNSIYIFLICFASLLVSFLKTFKSKDLKTEIAYPIIVFNLWLIFTWWMLYLFLNTFMLKYS